MAASVSTNPIYTSLSLDSTDKSIRLVELLKGEKSSIISCKFHRQSLRHSVSYTALSYRWGDTIGIKKEILVDNRLLKVGTNLWTFLQQAREQSDSTLFWIDAICINQHNIEERNHQVSLMKEIYSKATRVAVWLGPPEANSDMAIKRINNGLTRNKNKRVRYTWTAVEASAIFDLCQRKYWKRIWIVQEFVLAKDIILYCGQKVFTWKSISLMVDQLQDDTIPDRIEQNLFVDRVKSSYAAYIVNVKQRYELRRNVPDAGLTLNNLIETFKHMESTDFRDKVYGLLGLVQGRELEELSFSADYSKSTLQIYEQLLGAHYSHYRWDISRLRAFSELLKESMRLEPWGHRLELKLLDISQREERRRQDEEEEERRREERRLQDEEEEERQPEERRRQEEEEEERRRQEEEEEERQREEHRRHEEKISRIIEEMREESRRREERRRREVEREERRREEFYQEEKKMRIRGDYPPVIREVLDKYEINWIANNPKLQHDINFDPEFHLMTNLDGDKERRETQTVNHFWETMRVQLRNYLVGGEEFKKEFGGMPRCLLATLVGIRRILETLASQRGRDFVEEMLNIEHLIQQLRAGVTNLEKIVMWLSQLLQSLKRHCGLMWDNWVDEVTTQLSKSGQNGEATLLVAGIQDLLEVLEAMKTASISTKYQTPPIRLTCISKDFANHQLHRLRPLLIEDTVHCEQKYFMKQIAQGRIDIVGAHAWFRQASSLPNMNDSSLSEGTTWKFLKALVNLTLPSKSSEMIPRTFLFDKERLVKLRSDMLDLINLEICMFLYGDLDTQSRLQEPQYAELPEPDHFATFEPRHTISQERGQFIQLPSGRQVWVPGVDKDSQLVTSTSSSPRSFPSVTASTPATSYPPQPYYLRVPPSADPASQVRTTLVTMISWSTTNDKWTALIPDLALQILRSKITPLTHLPQFESLLALHVSNTRSSIFQDTESSVLSQLLPILQKLVESYTPLTSLQIFEAATAPRTLPGTVIARDEFEEEITEIATRIAHIGVLHWRVWAPLAYLVDPDAE